MASKKVIAAATSASSVSVSAAASASLGIKGDLQSTLSLSDDKIVQLISATHAPTSIQLDIKSLLNIVTNILNRATHIVDGIVTGTQVHLDSVEDKPYQADFYSPSSTIEKICCEMMCNCKASASGQVNLHQTTLSLFNKLSSYSWDAKAVLALAAFAVNFGDFWLLAQIHPTNQLAKPIATLKKLPLLMKPSSPVKNRMVALNSLTKIMLEVTTCIYEIEKLSVKNNAKDIPAISKALSETPLDVYLTIKSVLACAIQISSLTTGSSIESQIAAELSSLAPKLNITLSKLRNFLAEIYKTIEENRWYQKLMKLLVTHTENVELLKALFCVKDDMLIDLSTKRPVKIDHLRRKNVLLLISGLDISNEDLSILEKTYEECKEHVKKGGLNISLPFNIEFGIGGHEETESLYEVVWLPIVEQWTNEVQKKFESLKARMQWYTVHDLFATNQAVLRFLKESWTYRLGKPIVVTLNPQGKVECKDAMHMIKVWGIKAFPFTDARLKELWADNKPDNVGTLIFDGIHADWKIWVKEQRYIFLYGGDDTTWIQKFEDTVKLMSKELGISIVLVLVGKSTKESQDINFINRFWNRVESLLFAKMEDDEEVDPVSEEIQKMFGFKREGKWAALFKGSKLVVNGEGGFVLDIIVQYKSWINQVPGQGLDVVITEIVNKPAGGSGSTGSTTSPVRPPCCHFNYPASAGKIPESLKCPKCPRVMEKMVTFKCCHKEDHGAVNGI